MPIYIRQISFNTTDLSQATASSEIVDIRDERNAVCLITTTGAPTGSLTVTHFYGLPQHTPTGKSWTNNPTTVEQTFTPSGAGAVYKHIINSANGMPASAYRIDYTKTSGTGAIAAIHQCKGSGSA